MDEVHASLGLSVVRDGEMHVRGWRIPAEFTDTLAARWTLMFGEPDEMITPVEVMLAGAADAAEDGAVYLMSGEVRDA